ncbi:MAG: heat shock protein transcriptional repressor HspR [Actinomycetota bacterium]|nr:MerR family transcriptional regulator [Actinomycetota bacterium]
MVAKKPRKGDELAVYVISVAAELAGVHPQTLRMYERKGLVSPSRTTGQSRRYSDRDVEHVRLIQSLTQDKGVNLAGVEMVMALTRQLEETRRRMEALEISLRETQQRMRDEIERVRRSQRADLVPLRNTITVYKRER